MITNKNLWMDNIETRRSCWYCGQTDNLKTVYLKSGIRATELRYCRKCWEKITDLVWPEHKKEDYSKRASKL